MQTVIALAAALAVVLGGAGGALGVDVGVITGGEKGTYYQFGLDLQKLMKLNGINVNVHTSKGSVENIYAVYQRPGIQMGIVQADVLAFVGRLSSDATLKRIAKKTKMVVPLYNEEVHLLARRPIADFDDLAGKRVAIGREGSGTFLTARLLFKLSEVEPSEMVLIDTTEALGELKAGRIDAMFYVAGHPVRLFTDDVAETDQLALVPISNKSIMEFYPRAEIPANTYVWQPQPVETVAVKAVLVSFDYRRKDCENIGRFARVLSARVDWLLKNGHPKWKGVDLESSLPEWEQYDCVRRALGKAVPGTTARRPAANPVLDAIKQVLGNE